MVREIKEEMSMEQARKKNYERRWKIEWQEERKRRREKKIGYFWDYEKKIFLFYLEQLKLNVK